MQVTKLKISQTIAALETVVSTHVPTSGKRVSIRSFSGSGGGTLQFKLIWKYGGSEELLWGFTDEQNSLNSAILLPDGEINGSNTLAISIENPNVEDLLGSAIVEIVEEDIPAAPDSGSPQDPELDPVWPETE